MSTEILRQKNAALADFTDRWQAKYSRAYDLNSVSEQANFYEGVLEMARHMASSSQTGRLELSVSPDGPSSLKLNVTPI